MPEKVCKLQIKSICYPVKANKKGALYRLSRGGVGIHYTGENMGWTWVGIIQE